MHMPCKKPRPRGVNVFYPRTRKRRKNKLINKSEAVRLNPVRVEHRSFASQTHHGALDTAIWGYSSPVVRWLC